MDIIDVFCGIPPIFYHPKIRHFTKYESTLPEKQRDYVPIFQAYVAELPRFIKT